MSKNSEEEDVVDVVILKEGQLTILNTKKARFWGVLAPGRLYFKRNEKSTEIKGFIPLNGSKIEMATPSDIKKSTDSSFVITTSSGEKNIVTVDSKSVKQWVDIIKEAADKKADTEISFQNKKKQTLNMRMKKNIVGKIAGTKAGRKVIRDNIGPDGVKVIDVIKRVQVTLKYRTPHTHHTQAKLK
eukprot:TRINITY_DN2846_c0_g1_i5.p1 TRINITY_DN2846_c0_g1~~TRINITY_DN2846_c0_g1_i5.p1  ORF type:complete len:186 (+),score=41.81 TRINITY_DN2846_c0_g1_i5:67-624(+)